MMSEIHETEFVDGDWVCPECGQRRRLVDGRLRIIQWGDASAQHYGFEAPEGIDLSVGVEVQRDSGLSAEMETALEEIDLDFGEDGE